MRLSTINGNLINISKNRELYVICDTVTCSWSLLEAAGEVHDLLLIRGTVMSGS